MLLRCRSRGGDALPRPPLVSHRCHRPPPGVTAPSRGATAQSALHAAGGVGGPELPPGLPPAPRGGEWSPFRAMVARRAGGLNGACESRLGERPALISAAPPPQRRGVGTFPERPHGRDPRVPLARVIPTLGRLPQEHPAWRHVGGKRGWVGVSWGGFECVRPRCSRISREPGRGDFNIWATQSPPAGG